MAACLATPLRFLPLPLIELNLATVLRSGQTFRWHSFPTHVTREDAKEEANGLATDLTGEEWAYGWQDRTVVIRQSARGLHYRSLYPLDQPHTAYLADLTHDTTLPFLRKYFRLDTLIAPLYAQWTATDKHFAKKMLSGGDAFMGIRLLEQDPWEALIAFVCSSNNHISRIGQMVNKVCANLGRRLPHPNAFTPACIFTPETFAPPPSIPPSTDPAAFYAFPSPASLSTDDIPALLRDLGFGYRAPYIHATASLITTLPKGHLESLHASVPGGSIANTREKLLEFKGVGPKVADCVALFSLGWDNLVPVDTHVFQIAVRDYSFPASKTASLTPALHARVASRLQTLWGPHAGWLQQVLFFADLKPKSGTTTPKKETSVKPEPVAPVKAKWELELEELQRAPTKRRRVTIKVEEERVVAVGKPSGKKRKAAESPLSRKVKQEVLKEVREKILPADLRRRRLWSAVGESLTRSVSIMTNQVRVVLGSQWGDEGKGKLVDILAADADICARCAGGNNAGHTIVAQIKGVRTKFDFHLLPSGLVNPKCTAFIGSGVVVHVPAFFEELDALTKKGLNCDGRLLLSDRAHLVFDFHQIVDGLKEVELGGSSIGTTKKGIGPAYSSKASRSGLRVHHLFDEEAFATKFRTLVEGRFKRYGTFEYDTEGEIERYKHLAARLKPYVVDGPTFLHQAMKENKRILVEGANALMLDMDFGTYPFVTSSPTGIGGVCTGLGLPPRAIGETIGVVKAYTTRVGAGPFPTEQLNATGVHLQEVGAEWGVTTGRRRRCGWLDLVVLKYSDLINGYTALNLTKLDVLDALPTIKIATAYHLDGKPMEAYFPADLETVARVEVQYVELPGWEKSIADCRKFEDLPENCQKYVEFIETFLGVKIGWIGVGPDREAMIVRV